MRAGMMARAWLISLSILVLIPGCDPWFEYSPYDTRLDDAYAGTTAKNLELIAGSSADDSRPFKVALLSDPHYHFSKLRDAINHVNSQGDYSFAIVAGDLTENGLRQEFVYFHNLMANLRIPYLTVIGNHDYLANGEIIYREMFGSYNYTFAFNNVKFVVFDNNTVESSKDPDMDWLEHEIQNGHGYDHVIPLAHIPPYDVQMRDHSERYHQILAKENIALSLHGHRHDWSREEVFGDGIEYVTVSSPQKRSYTELTITSSGLEVRKVEY